MRAVTPVITGIIIISLSILLVALFWLFIYGTYSSLTSSGESTVGRTLVTISSCMKIESVSRNKVYVKNCGEGVITQDSLKVYFDDIPLNITSVTTFGNTNIGSNGGGTANRIFGSKFKLTQSAIVSKITSYLSTYVGSYASAAIYSDSGGLPNELLAKTNSINLPYSFEWVDFSLNSFLSPGDYWLIIKCNSCYYKYDSGGSNQWAATWWYDEGFPSQFGYVDHQEDWNMTIYATYTPIINKDEVGIINLQGLWSLPPGGHLLKVTNPKVIAEREVESSLHDSAVLVLDFDEGSGTIAHDKSGHNNHGNLEGGTTWVKGKYGKALEFDGIGDYVNITDSISLDVTTEITIQAWFYLKSWSSDYPIIVCKDTGITADPYHLELDRFNNYVILCLDAGGGATCVNSGTNSISINKWYHIAGTWNGTHEQIYINGQSKGVTGLIGTMSATNNDVLIGNNPTNIRQFNGTIDSVRIYNKTLTPDETVILKPVKYY